MSRDRPGWRLEEKRDSSSFSFGVVEKEEYILKYK